MDFLNALSIKKENSGASTGNEWIGRTSDEKIQVISPVDGQVIASVHPASAHAYEQIAKTSHKAYLKWRNVPAPKRGDVIRHIGNRIRRYKDPLGRLVSYETGKSIQEGLGEVQEMIDICDVALGQSRQLYGLTMQSERPDHRMYEQYLPIGVVGVISAFNFPAAVWSWNAMIAAVCGNATLWKPSSKVPLTAIAIQHLLSEVIHDHQLPEGLFSLAVGRGATIGEALLNDSRIPLVSITGSTGVGRHGAQIVAKRFGRTILELGGNNAVILTPHADLNLAIPSVVFGAVGTAGQRCTTTRRLIIHESIFDPVRAALEQAYQSIKIGTPLDPGNHMGPLIDQQAVKDYRRALGELKSQGGEIISGGRVLTGSGYESGCYVEPAICIAKNHYPIVQEETFAPILYLIRYKGDVTDAVALQNDVKQGLSSAIFTNNLQESETFLSLNGSDCGIANVNIGTSGAEIGGAFGGEKETGNGREAGSDAWKQYMRRQTNTINYGKQLPLAQGIRFELQG